MQELRPNPAGCRPEHPGDRETVRYVVARETAPHVTPGMRAGCFTVAVCPLGP